MPTKSQKLFKEALKHIPGGVNSPVRAFNSVGGTPVFFRSAKGALMYDVDGKEYIDYVGSWGPMILGHAFPPVIRALQETASNGTSFGAPMELEIRIAALIKEMVPGIDKIRMVNSGTEACMSAIRLARGYTGKNKIIKFEGCYHGHADSFLIKAGSGSSTLGVADSAGVPSAVSADTLVATYNNMDSVNRLLGEHQNEVAAIIVEPVAGNMGCIPPEKDFLKNLREISKQQQVVLIFDEVMTGFRIAKGGAIEKYSVQPDLVTYGKIIGGGLPVGAYAGKNEIMSMISPKGPVYQAGTLSGNPLAMISGFSTLSYLNDHPEIYSDLEQKGQYFEAELKAVFLEKGINIIINRVASMISLHFVKEAVKDLESAKQGDHDFFKKFFHNMLKAGIYLPPSPYESWFISQAHSQEHFDKTVEAVRNAV